MSECRCMNCGQPIVQNLCSCGAVNNYPNLPYSFQPVQQAPYIQPVVAAQPYFVQPVQLAKKRSILGCVTASIFIAALVFFIFSLILHYGYGGIFFILAQLFFIVAGVLGIIDLAMGENVQPYQKLITDDVIAIVFGSIATIISIIVLATL